MSLPSPKSETFHFLYFGEPFFLGGGEFGEGKSVGSGHIEGKYKVEILCEHIPNF